MYIKTVALQSLFFYICAMKIWLKSICISLALSLFGFYVNSINVPNQQIVIEFSDAEISSKALLITLEDVAKQLQNIGADQVRIIKNTDVSFKITYYSTENVTEIQQQFSKNNVLKLHSETNQNPLKSPSKNKGGANFALNVSVIKDGNPITWSLEGVLISEFNPKSDRLYPLKVFTSGYFTQIKRKTFSGYNTVSFKFTTNVSTSLHSFLIPEVRAGPSV